MSRLVTGEKKVFPGDRLGIIEEYMPGSDVYEDKDGYLRSSVTGIALYDSIKKVVNIKPVTRKYHILKPGDIVEGVVTYMNDDLAFIKIYWVEDRRLTKTVDALGILHISQTSQSFVESMYDVVRLNDIVRAKILGGRGVYQLTIKEPQLGVIYAKCVYCGAPLVYDSGRLVCSSCGEVNKRKASINYILVKH
ncbi:exosome complex RNA-binding protein Csl4 [Thermogladius sp. 4427co]|uniref:exosome complex RNA-binding protein Csl4 n=1 Tax=Thermogladius sp. 4427co TaxID=3450718 RepID=UPI003F79221D